MLKLTSAGWGRCSVGCERERRRTDTAPPRRSAGVRTWKRLAMGGCALAALLALPGTAVADESYPVSFAHS